MKLKSAKLLYSILLLLILQLFFLTPKISANFAGGEGTKENPYLVENAHHLNNIRHNLDSHFKQISDIDLSDYSNNEGWEPIGDQFTSEFNGTYNGNNYKISSLNIYQPMGINSIGLFEHIGENAKIKNIKLEEVDITGNMVVGALAGLNDGKIKNSSASGEVSGEFVVGGLVGELFQGEIKNSFFNGNVSGIEEIGGLAAGIEEGKIINSYVLGNIDGEVWVGGLVGMILDGEIINSYSTATIQGENHIGGLIGENINSEVTYSYFDNKSNDSIADQNNAKDQKELKKKDTFEPEWDFNDIWTIEEDDSYPYFQWQDNNIPYPPE